MALALAFSVARADAPPLDAFPNTGAFKAKWIKSQDDVAVIQLDGIYDRELNGKTNAEPRAVVGREFLARHADRYDFVVVFSTFEFDTGDALAFYLGVRNDTKGIGREPFDHSAWFGSSSKLQGYIDMAALSRYTLEPTSPKFDEVLDTLSHEFLHRWAAEIRYRASDGTASNALLGKDGAHWSFLLDSQGSVEYGNRWRDNGDGTFTSIGSRQYFSPLDLYLMGLLRKEEVPPFFLIENPAVDPTALPETGRTISGVRRNISIDDIIAVEGERIPSSSQAQKDFQIGFVLLTRPGLMPNDEQIAGVARVRKAFQTRLAAMTAGRAIAQGYLQPRGADAAGLPGLPGQTVGGGSANAMSAIDWLRTKQSSEGAWRDHALTGVRDTAVVVGALADTIGAAEPAVMQGQGWLLGQTLKNTDYLARRIVAAGGAASAADVSALWERQNADGGWGAAAGYASDVVDTAWAMMALRGDQDRARASAGLLMATTYLLARQNADGGWSGSAAGASRIAATAMAMQGLASEAQAEPALEKAAAFLAGKQNVDGGFGDSPSTVHDTANALTALAAVGHLGAVRVDTAFGFIHGTQRQDGSWDGTAYSTALALGMLKGANAFDWVVSALQVAPAEVRDGELVQVRVRISNGGTAAAPAGVLRIYDGLPNEGGKPIGPDLVVPVLAPGEVVVVETRWDTRGKAGGHTLYAMADPDGSATEISRRNNSASASVQVRAADNVVDLAILPLSVTVSPTRIERLPQNVTVAATVANLGMVDAQSVRVVLRAADGAELDSTTVNLLGRSAVPVTLVAVKTQGGSSQYTLEVDPDGATADVDRTNNKTTVSVASEATIDLAISAADISVPASPLYLGSDVSLRVRVRNLGTSYAPPFDTVLAVSDGTNTREIGRRTLQVDAGASLETTFVWRADLAGTLTLTVQLDPSHSIADADPANNQASVPLTVVPAQGGVNLATSYHDIRIDPAVALEGSALRLATLVSNTGTVAASKVEVGLYDDDPAFGGRLVAPLQVIDALAPGASVDVLFEIPPLIGSADRLYFVAADPGSKIAELTRVDNVAFVVVSPLSLPDLVVNDGALHVVPTEPRPGQQVEVKLDIVNIGAQPAGGFNVRLYAGTVAAGNELAAPVRIAGLAPNANAVARFSLTLPDSAAAIGLIAVADADSEIVEQTKANNTARHGMNVQTGDSFATERYFSPNGDGIKDTTVFGFRLATADTVSVVVVNAVGQTVRSFAGDGLTDIREGSVEWDGRDDWGRVVRDGEYRLRAIGSSGQVSAEQVVSVDTNRLPIVRAFGTDKELYRNLSCGINSLYDYSFTADEESVFFTTSNSDERLPYNTGVYRMSAYGGNVTAVYPNSLLRTDGGYAIDALTVSEQGERVAFIKRGKVVRPDSSTFYYGDILAATGDGKELVRLYSNIPTAGNSDRIAYYSADFLLLSSDGRELVSSVTLAYEHFGADLIRRTSTTNPAVEQILFDGRVGEFDRASMVALAPSRRKAIMRVQVRGEWSSEYAVLDLETGLLRRFPLALFGRRDVTYQSAYWSPDSRLFVLAGTVSELGLGDDQSNFVLDVFDADFEHHRRFRTGLPTSEATSWYGGQITNIEWADTDDEFIFGVDRSMLGFARADAEAKDEDASGRVYRADMKTGQLEVVEAIDGAARRSFYWSPADRSVLAPHSWGVGLPEDVTTYFLDENTRRGGFDNWFATYPGGYASLQPHRFLPSGRRFLFYSGRDGSDEGGACYGDGSNLFSYESLENLVVDLQAMRMAGAGGVLLRGTVSDAHLERYRIDYAPVTAPDAWQPTGLAGTEVRIGAKLGLWVPPGFGNYFVRLTAEDSAGNVRQSVQRVLYSDTPPISGLQTNNDYISPNDDGVQDSLVLSYRVLEPVHLIFEVFDEDGVRVRLTEKDEPRIGEAAYEWDGRNDRGIVVPDGKYRIRVLDFEFDVEVDNTPPTITMVFPERPMLLANGDGGKPKEKEPTIDWQASDRNLLAYAYEEQARDSSEWGPVSGLLRYSVEELQEGLEKVVRIHDSLDPRNSAREPKDPWRDYTNKRMRLTATDRAGNRTVILTPTPAAEVFLGLLQTRLDRAIKLECDGTTEEVEVIPPVIIGRLGPYPPANDVQTVLEAGKEGGPNYYQLQFVSTSETEVSRAMLEVALDYKPEAAPVWSFARTLFSQDVLFPVDPPDATLSGGPFWPGRLSTVTITIGGESLITREHDVAVRLTLVYQDGTTRSSNPIWIRDGVTTLFPPCAAYSHVIAAEVPDCNAAPSATMAYRFQWPDPLLTGSPLPESVEIERASADGVRTLLATGKPDGSNNYQLQGVFSVVEWPQGEQQILVREWMARTKNGQKVLEKQESLHSFVVDHVGPRGEIVSPRTGERMCASHLRDAKGVLRAFVPLTGKQDVAENGYWAVEMRKVGAETWQPVRPSGVKDWSLVIQPDDAQSFDIERATEIGDGEQIAEACAAEGDACRYFGPVQWSTLKSFRNTPGENRLLASTRLFEPAGMKLFNGEVEARLQFFGPSGHRICTPPVAFSVDGVVESSTLARDVRLFSPNGDGRLDTVTLRTDLGEDVTAFARIYRASRTDQGKLVVDRSRVVRTLLSGQTYGPGTLEFTWDGLDDGGAVAADGLYAIELTLTDGCGNENVDIVDVTVDNTPPAISLSAPDGVAPAGLDVLIAGTMTDLHFRNYHVEIARADAPDTWMSIAGGNEQNSDGRTIAHWNTAGLSGSYLLRIRASDHAENEGVLVVPVLISEQAGLLAGVEATPDPFSPNGDGRREQVTLAIGLERAAKLTLEIFAAGGEKLATLLNEEATAAGIRRLSWNGRNEHGQPFADGVLTARVTAQATAAPLVSEVQTTQFVLDGTPPVISVTHPAGEYVSGAAGISVAVTDRALDSSRLFLATGGVNGAWTQLLEGSLDEAKALRAPLDEYPEGRYGLKVTAVDQAENVAEVLREFEIDRTPPVVALTAPVAGVVVGAIKGPVPIVGSVEEKNLERYRLLLAQGAPPETRAELANGTKLPLPSQLLAWDVSTVPDGEYSLILRADDLAGQSGEASVKLIVDNTPPVAQLTVPEPGSPWYLHAGSVVKGVATDANFESYTLEVVPGKSAGAGALWTPIAQGTAPVDGETLARLDALPPDGAASLRLTVVDKAGNTTQTFAEIVVDNTPPAAPLDLSATLEDRFDAHLSWRDNVEPDLAGYAVFRDGVRITDALLTGTTYVDAGLKEGHYTYVVKAYDLGGMESKGSQPAYVTVVLTQPVAKLYTPGAGAYVSGLAEIKGTANAPADFKEYRVRVGAGDAPTSWQQLRRSPQPVTADVLTEWNTQVLAEGLYTIRLEAEDLTGQLASDQVTVTVDNTPPRAPLNLTGVLNGADAHLTWTAGSEPDLAGYILYRDERIANAPGVVVGPLTPFIIALTDYDDRQLPDGKHRYYVQAIDRAGNLSDPSNVVELSVDLRPPHVVIIKPADGSAIDRVTYLIGSTEDTDIARVQFEYQAPGESVWTPIGAPVTAEPWAITWTADGLPHGDYQVRAVATDLAGHVDPAPTPIVLRLTELEPPVAPTALTARVAGGDVALAWTASDADDLAGYRIERARADTQPREWTPVVTDPVVGTTHDDGGLDDARYVYRVFAVDTADNVSKPSNEALAQVFTPSFEQPYTPTAAAQSRVEGVTEPDLQVWLDRAGGQNVLQGTSDAEGRFAFGDFALEPGDNRFVLYATDAAGNRSKDALFHVVRGQVPARPTGLAAQVDGQALDWRWDANGEADLLGYLVGVDGTYGSVVPTVSVVSASSETPGTWWNAYGGHAGNAVDGLLNTGWQPLYDVARGNDWLVAQFSEPVVVSSVRLQWAEGNTVPRAFRVEGYDGEAWVTLARLADNIRADMTVKLAAPYRTDRIRVRVTSTEQPYLLEMQTRAHVVAPTAQWRSEGLVDGRHTLEVKAITRLALVSEPSRHEADFGDVLPAPVLSASVLGSDVTLQWAPPAGVEVVRYVLRRDGQDLVTFDNGSVTSYADLARPNGTYSYTIIATERGGRVSPESAPALATVAVTGSVGALELVATAPAVGRRVDLSWQVASGPAPSSYTLERKTAGDAYQTIVTGLSALAYADLSVANGTTYWYRVIGHDAAGNPGVPSNEAQATPRDRMAPLPPVFVHPVTGGQSISTQAAETALRGFSEMGARVDVTKNGATLISVTATETEAHQTQATDWLYGFSPAPDGRSAFVRSSGGSHLLDLTTGRRTKVAGLPSEVSGAVFGGRGEWALMRGFSNTDWEYHAYLWRRADNSAVPVAPQVFLRDAPSVSPDGLQVVVNAIDVSYEQQGLWLMDPQGNDARLLVADPDGSIAGPAAWSADSARVAHATTQDEIVVTRLSDGTRQTFAAGREPKAPVWLPEGDAIVFDARTAQDTRQLMRLDVTSGTVTALTPATEDYAGAVLSPTGDRLLARRGEALVVRGLDGTNERVIADTFQADGGFYWDGGGLIHYTADNESIETVTPQGLFVVPQAALGFGDNVFGARAVDDSGNVGHPAVPITVRRLGDGLPDLAIAAEDIVTVPAAGQIGERVQIAARVHNLGEAVANAPVVVYVRDPNGATQTLLDTTITSAGHDVQSILANWTPTLAGRYVLTVVVDPAAILVEQRVDNNRATREYLVGGGSDGGVQLGLTVANSHVTAQGTLKGTVLLDNAGPQFDGTVRLHVEDTAGYLVARLPDQTVTALAFGASRSLPAQWDSGSTLAGNYRLVAELLALDGKSVARAQAGFVLDPQRSFALSVAADQAQYAAGASIHLRGTVEYVEGNAALSAQAQTRLRILDGAGGVLHSATQAAAGLSEGISASQTLVLSADTLGAGAYQAEFMLFEAGEQELGRATTPFIVLPAAGVALKGRFDMGDVMVEPGDPMHLSYVLTNTGTQALAGVPVRVRVVDFERTAELAARDATATIDVGGQANTNVDFAAQTWPVRTLRAVLEAQLGGAWLLLDQASVYVVNRTGPTVQFVAPEDGALFGVQSIEAIVRAVGRGSLVQRVELSLDGANWTRMVPHQVADSTYAAILPESLDGAVSLYARAYDAAGNVSAIARIGIEIDRDPPVIQVTGVEDGGIYGATVSAQIEVTDAHPKSWHALLDDAAYTSGTPIGAGAHKLVIEAEDAVGNTARRELNFVVDLGQLTVAIIQPANGAIVRAADPVQASVLGAPSGISQVTLAVDGAGALRMDEATAGLYRLNGLALADGEHALVATATDRAGNTAASPAVTVTIDTIPPEILITGVANGETYSGAVTPLIEVRELHPDVTRIMLDGADYASGMAVSAGGTHVLKVVAVDKAGNRSERELSFVLRGEAPSAAWQAPAAGAIVRTPLDLVLNASSPAGIEAVSGTLDGGTPLSFAQAGTAGVWQVASGALADGPHEANAQVRATDGGVLDLPPLPFVVDNTPPVITVTGVEDSGLYAAETAAQIEVTDANLQSWQARLDDVAYVSGTPIGEGTHRLVVEAQDAAGNTARQELSFVVDAGPPTVAITQPENGAIVRAADPVQVQATDALSGVSQVTLAVDGAGALPMSEATAGVYRFEGLALADGEHTLVATATDRAGNTAASPVVTVTIDTIPPEIVITGVADGETYSGAVTPLIEVRELHPDVTEITLDGATYASGMAVSATGTHVLKVVAVDRAGNRSERELSFVLRGEAPSAAWQAPAAGAIVRTPLDLVLNASSPAGIEAVSGTLDGATPLSFAQAGTAGVWQASSGALADGPHKANAQVRATDGGVTDLPLLPFVVDNTPPVITVTGVVEGGVYREAVTPVFTATDLHLDTVTATLNGALYISGTPVTAAGNWALTVTATDKAGNIAHQTVSFVLAPLSLEGHLTVTPQEAPAGSPVSIEAHVTNVSAAALAGATATITIRDAASGQVVQTYPATFDLAAGATHQRAVAWTPSGTPVAHYDIVLTLTTDGKTTELDRARFTMTEAEVKLDLSARIVAGANVLVFSQCRRAADDAQGACTPRNYKADADRDRLTACDADRAATLSRYLTGLGVRHTIVEDEATFLQKLRSGAYNAYWLSGNAAALRASIVDELTASVLRGNGLIVDGMHDGRSRELEPVLGVRYQGKSPASRGELSLLGTSFGSGTYPVTASLLHVEPLPAATLEARLDEPANHDAGGIVSNTFGRGRAVLFGFDLAATLQEGRDTDAWTQAMQGALTVALPSAPDEPHIVGAVADLQVLVRNRASVAQVQLTETLPSAASVLSAQPAPASLAVVSGNPTAIWTQTIPGGDPWQVDTQIRLPFDAGTYAITATLDTVVGGTTGFYATQAVSVQVQSVAQLIDLAISQLQSMSAQGAAELARTTAIRHLGTARLAAASGRNWPATIKFLLTVQRYVLAIDATPPAAAITVGKAIAAVEQKL